MLAAILLRPGRAATIDELAEALWGTDVPASARTTLRTYAWRLRKALENDTKPPTTLISVGDGYQIALNGVFTDFIAVRDLVDKAQQAQVSEAYELLGEAIGLWTGEPLAGLPGPYAERQRDRFNQLRMNIQEERIWNGLRLGHGSAHIDDLETLIEQDPLRERPYALLMRAHYHASRRAEALATYRRARERLIGELGVEPGRELMTLQRQVLEDDLDEDGLDEDDSMRPPPRSSTPPAASGAQNNPAAETAGPADHSPTPSLVPAQLPPDIPDFTGRAHLTTALNSALSTANRTALPIVVLTGMGGVGKTTLALHVAHSIRLAYPDGQLYVDLRGSSEEPLLPHFALAQFLEALGVSPGQIPEAVEARTALLRTVLDQRRVLLVLDNARDSEQVCPLLPGSSSCGVLVTTRFRLVGIPAALQANLPAFYPAEALALLRSLVGTDRVAAELDSALDLIESCVRLPLAVRVVATRLAGRPNWSISALAQRLSNKERRLHELKAGEFAVATVFEVSYRQLSADQSIAFRIISCIDGPSFSLNHAAALLGFDELKTEDLLEELVDAAMLESTSVSRYRMHDLLRDFARTKATPGEQREALHRTLNFLLASAIEAFELMVPGDAVRDVLGPAIGEGMRFTAPAQARSWIKTEGEFINVVAAQVVRMAEQQHTEHSRSWIRILADILVALSFFKGELPLESWRGIIGPLIKSAVRCGDLCAESRAHLVNGIMALDVTQLEKAEKEFQLTVEQCREIDDAVILRQALNYLGLVEQLQDRFTEAMAHYEKSIALARQLGHTSGEVAATINTALLMVRSGQPQKSEQICMELLERFVNLDDEGLSYTHYVLGLTQHALGRYDEAVTWYEQCLARCVSAGIRSRESFVRFRLADSLCALSEPVRAMSEASKAAEMCKESGDERNLAFALLALSTAERDVGELASARSHATRAYAILSRLGISDVARSAELLDSVATLEKLDA